MAERNISRVINGVTLRGTYSVKEGIVIVRTDFGSKSTQFVRGSKCHFRLQVALSTAPMI
jgi:hypothetical protein